MTNFYIQCIYKEYMWKQRICRRYNWKDGDQKMVGYIYILHIIPLNHFFPFENSDLGTDPFLMKSSGLPVLFLIFAPSAMVLNPLLNLSAENPNLRKTFTTLGVIAAVIGTLINIKDLWIP